MTPSEEYENFAGGRETSDAEACRQCNDYPCRCLSEGNCGIFDYDAPA